MLIGIVLRGSAFVFRKYDSTEDAVLAVTGVEALYADMGHFGRQAISRRVGCGLRQPKVNDFGSYSASLLDIHHDVAWFDVPVDELLFVHCSQTGSDLRRDFQRGPYLQLA
jgi:hypothetical protein